MNTNTKLDKSVSNEPAGAGNLPLPHQLNFPKAFFDPNPCSFKTNLQNALSNFQTHAQHAFDAAMTNLFYLNSHTQRRNNNNNNNNPPQRNRNRAEAIEERLAGVPVYALSNASDEFLLVSGASTGKNLGLFCFNKQDAESLLQQVTSVDPLMRQGSKVVPVALDKVFQLKVDGVAFRFIPEYSQIKNALTERERSGVSSKGFSGVPVFQSRSLILMSQNKKYRPLFFRKEDLENSLQRAARQQNQLNLALRQGDIQVSVLEDVIKEMKENSTSNWDDVIFIPPGFDISTEQ